MISFTIIEVCSGDMTFEKKNPNFILRIKSITLKTLFVHNSFQLGPLWNSLVENSNIIIAYCKQNKLFFKQRFLNFSLFTGISMRIVGSEKPVSDQYIFLGLVRRMSHENI